MDDGVGEAGIHGSPVRSTIGALEYTTTVSSRIEGVRCLRINGKGRDIGVGEAGIHGSPVRSTIGALEYTTTVSSRIEGVRCLRINGKGSMTSRCW